MRKSFSTMVLTLATMLFFTACTNNDDETDYSNDCNIYSISLGSIYRQLRTLSREGNDSIFYGVYTGNNYTMHIDQLKGLIYNTDSLLYNSDPSRMLITLGANGSVAYRVKDDPQSEWKAYSAKDSINFSKPLEFKVFAEDGISSRSYTVTVNVHQQENDKFNWSKLGTNNSLQQISRKKMMMSDGSFELFGIANGNVVRATSALSDGITWNIMQASGCDDADPSTVQKFQNNYYMTNSSGTLYTSADGMIWSIRSTGVIDKLLTANEYEMYALKDGRLIATKEATTWYEEQLDENSSLLPTEHIAAISYPLKTNKNTHRILLLGSRSSTNYPADTHAVVWGKLYNIASRSYNIWSYYNVSPDNRTPCPRLQNLTLISYDDKMFAFGGRNSNTQIENEALDAFYVSRDNGITWKKSDHISPPETLKGTTEEFTATVDTNHYIWLLCGNEIWRGRLNRLGFESNDNIFTE